MPSRLPSLLPLLLMAGCMSSGTVASETWPVPIRVCPNDAEDQSVSLLRGAVSGSTFFVMFQVRESLECSEPAPVPEEFAPNPETTGPSIYLTWTDDRGASFRVPQLMTARPGDANDSASLVSDEEGGVWALVPYQKNQVSDDTNRWLLVHAVPGGDQWKSELLQEPVSDISPPTGGRTDIVLGPDGPNAIALSFRSGGSALLNLASSVSGWEFENVDPQATQPYDWPATSRGDRSLPWTGDFNGTFQSLDGSLGRFWSTDTDLVFGGVAVPFSERSWELPAEVVPAPEARPAASRGDQFIAFVANRGAWPWTRRLVVGRLDAPRVLEWPWDDLDGTVDSSETPAATVGITPQGVAWTLSLTPDSAFVARIPPNGELEQAWWDLPERVGPFLPGYHTGRLGDDGWLHYVNGSRGLYGGAELAFALP